MKVDEALKGELKKVRTVPKAKAAERVRFGSDIGLFPGFQANPS
ncbi:hypothetical protein [Rhizobium lentis]|nr:hypothetical protein [Rhizobium lentis]